MPLPRKHLTDFYQSLLQPDNFNDYCPNGLQVEGAESISRIAFSVSATRESISRTIEREAHCLVVHHGLFWKFHGPRCITGPFARRLIPLIRHNINLYAYHLPLDAHLQTGNAATLGQLLGCLDPQPFGDFKGSPTGIRARLEKPQTASALKLSLQQLLQHPVILASDNPDRPVNTVGIITGGANSDWQSAVDEGLDAYITGEISEHDWHESREAGIHMFAGGHHATEQFGIQALMGITQDKFDIECFYLDSDNPA